MSAVPSWLQGLWKRLSVEFADGQRDTETEVFYLQTPTCFGDLRIPANRPHLKRANFYSLTQADILVLAQQQGFAGIAQFDQECCQWMRYIDYQPPQPVRDIGLLYWKDDILIEEGIDQIYREEWQKVDDGGGDYTALVLTDANTPHSTASWQASLVIAGDYFIYSQNRSIPLPSDSPKKENVAHRSLSHYLMGAAPQIQKDYLACEISFGRCQSGRVSWEIQRSTIPWREGSALWSPVNLVIDLEKRRVLQTGHQKIQEWQIWEWGTGQAFMI